jgi:hypothetical protein
VASEAADTQVLGELGERYEQLRAIVLGGRAGGNGLGLGVLASRGMAAWITVWRSDPPPASPVPAAAPTADALVPAADGGQLELVHVLAAIALAHLHL